VVLATASDDGEESDAHSVERAVGGALDGSSETDGVDAGRLDLVVLGPA
jgi:hypothetical protein